MKTYAESVGDEPFDWNKFLANPPDVDDDESWQCVKRLSNGWVTCACGNQCAGIGRSWDGVPVDQRLRELGYDFNHAIDDRDPERAIATLAKIETRSSEILAEMGITK